MPPPTKAIIILCARKSKKTSRKIANLTKRGATVFWVNVLLKIILIITTTLLLFKFIRLVELDSDPSAEEMFCWLKAYVVLILLATGLFSILFLFNISITTALRIAACVMSAIWAIYATIAVIKWKDASFLVNAIALLLIPAAVLFFYDWA